MPPLIQQIRPFVSFCQACGFFPYVMEYHPITGEFVKFTFSYRNLTTWWFVFIIVYHIVSPIGALSESRKYVNLLTTDPELPITVTLCGAGNVLSSYIQIFSIRWMVLFRYRGLQNAVSQVLKVEKLLHETSKISPANYSLKITKRFVVGFLLIVTGVSLRSSFLTSSSIFNWWPYIWSYTLKGYRCIDFHGADITIIFLPRETRSGNSSAVWSKPHIYYAWLSNPWNSSLLLHHRSLC